MSSLRQFGQLCNYLRQFLVIENQKSGTPHGHALIYAPTKSAYRREAKRIWEELTGGIARVSAYDQDRGAARYVTKALDADDSLVVLGPWLPYDDIIPKEIATSLVKNADSKSPDVDIASMRAEKVDPAALIALASSRSEPQESMEQLCASSQVQPASQRLDGWVVPPDTRGQRERGRGSGRRTGTMAQELSELVEQFCNYQRKQRGRTLGGVQTYRWILEQFVAFARNRHGRLARVTDLTSKAVQAWMDDMGATELALSTMRVRQSVVSSFCAWLVKREVLVANPVASLERPPHRREPPKQVPGASLMDALVEAAKGRHRPRDVAVFLILRYTGMRRESVATLQLHHLDGMWGLRGVRVKGGKTRDIPLPTAVMTFLHAYVEQVLSRDVKQVGPETPLFWSTWGRRAVGKTRAPMTGKNIWRLSKVYGRLIGYPELKPHDLRHGVAMEVLEQHHDLEEVRALLGHARIDTTQIYTSIRPARLKRAVEFYEEKAAQMLNK